MNSKKVSSTDIIHILSPFRNNGLVYFEKAVPLLKEPSDPYQWKLSQMRDYYWEKLTPVLQKKATILISDLIKIGDRLAKEARDGLLTSEADEREVSVGVKAIRASILFRDFRSWDTEAIHDEGRVYGISRAGHSDNDPCSPSDSKRAFMNRVDKLFEIAELVVNSSGSSSLTETPELGQATRYRPGTAFVMMSMNKNDPSLSDVLDAAETSLQRVRNRCHPR